MRYVSFYLIVILSFGFFGTVLTGCAKKSAPQVARQKSHCITTAPTAKGPLRLVNCAK
jgi:hypothetical protein